MTCFSHCCLHKAKENCQDTLVTDIFRKYGGPAATSFSNQFSYWRRLLTPFRSPISPELCHKDVDRLDLSSQDRVSRLRTTKSRTSILSHCIHSTYHRRVDAPLRTISLRTTISPSVNQIVFGLNEMRSSLPASTKILLYTLTLNARRLTCFACLRIR